MVIFSIANHIIASKKNTETKYFRNTNMLLSDFGGHNVTFHGLICDVSCRMGFTRTCTHTHTVKML